MVLSAEIFDGAAVAVVDTAIDAGWQRPAAIVVGGGACGKVGGVVELRRQRRQCRERGIERKAESR